MVCQSKSLSEFHPEAPIILLLRDPIERVLSAYRNFCTLPCTSQNLEDTLFKVPPPALTTGCGRDPDLYLQPTLGLRGSRLAVLSGGRQALLRVPLRVLLGEGGLGAAHERPDPLLDLLEPSQALAGALATAESLDLLVGGIFKRPPSLHERLFPGGAQLARLWPPAGRHLRRMSRPQGHQPGRPSQEVKVRRIDDPGANSARGTSHSKEQDIFVPHLKELRTLLTDTIAKATREPH